MNVSSWSIRNPIPAIMAFVLLTLMPAAALMDVIEIAHIPPPQGLQGLGQAVRGRRGQQQVKVVVQQHKGMQGTTMGLRCIDQQIQKAGAIRIRQKHRLPVVATLNHMVRQARHRKTGQAGHKRAELAEKPRW